ncbi:MAG: ferredoxin family protein [Solirubrobacterales bacterium]|nr:ferredoxin family protein [Solirubrobacterales bacterium]
MSENEQALFIRVEVDEPVLSDPGLAPRLEEVCPVDIFRATASGVEIVEENLDECVLCELCITAVPVGTVRVVKLYSAQTLPA